MDYFCLLLRKQRSWRLRWPGLMALWASDGQVLLACSTATAGEVFGWNVSVQQPKARTRVLQCQTLAVIRRLLYGCFVRHANCRYGWRKDVPPTLSLTQ